MYSVNLHQQLEAVLTGLQLLPPLPPTSFSTTQRECNKMKKKNIAKVFYENCIQNRNLMKKQIQHF